MDYQVKIKKHREVVSAPDASAALELAIISYNEEYDTAAMDWFLCGGSDDDAFDEEVGSIPHLEHMGQHLIDADTRGHEWAEYTGQDETGRVVVAIAERIKER